MDAEHTKRLAQILRYITRMHDSLNEADDTVLFDYHSFTEIQHSSNAFQFYAPPADPTTEACWLRLTRPVGATEAGDPPERGPQVLEYLRRWGVKRITLAVLDDAPKSEEPEVRRYIRRLRKYLTRRNVRRLEQIYNRLFEYTQQDEELLVWGIGHVTAPTHKGPLLEVLMEVEPARDGALLVRPRPDIAVHRHVPATRLVLPEVSRISPGQPTSYIPFLQDWALEWSSDAVFAVSTKSTKAETVLTPAWSVYSRPKPSSVWARDAAAWADLLKSGTPVEVPQATRTLTLGHQELVSQESSGWWRWMSRTEPPPKPLLALPSSQAQEQLADWLLCKQYPAVVCEGPPGTGKTHTIANIVCAYLSQGKRVLVTSKNARALSVLRGRLPERIQELCVDVSRSELDGMRQLQKTVEELVVRLAGSEHSEQRSWLEDSIQVMEQQRSEIDAQLEQRCSVARSILSKPNGEEFVQLSLGLIKDAPWLAQTQWHRRSDLSTLVRVVSGLVVDDWTTVTAVQGFEYPPPANLVTMVAAKAGLVTSAAKMASMNAVSSLPVVGSWLGFDRNATEEELSKLTLDGNAPRTPFDWKRVLHALEHARAVHEFETETWQSYVVSRQWPESNFWQNLDHLADLKSLLQRAHRILVLSRELGIPAFVESESSRRVLEERRSILSRRIREQTTELVNCTVADQLRRSFSPEAHSALTRFAQVAGRAKFNKANVAKMSQRQRRRRQEYLDAFDQCCRYIPCWILTTSQISDYLPTENLFDLCVIDEASQSDITVLPGMLRGKQWLVVGDGKQVMPSECFVSEDVVDNLKANLPESPFGSSFLPGESFFDLCANAFPKTRVFLSEHFRCAEEIIEFSNHHFYFDRLVPMRLPSRSERFTPSIKDVFVPGGVKEGKTNDKEADRIVELIKEMVENTAGTARSIGVISLLGEEQSRLIRGRLLDAIGPQAMSLHSIEVGEPPNFQGAERDVIFLSMVCSPGRVPTQSQLMHFQRANVALSRARDQIVLVRSIDFVHIPSRDDMKMPILEFFKGATGSGDDTMNDVVASTNAHVQPLCDVLMGMLGERGFRSRSMGAVWPLGISVESSTSDTRAAIRVDCFGESEQEWQAGFRQQQAIQRVGWACRRVDALSLLIDPQGTCEAISKFLVSVGVEHVTHVEDPPVADTDTVVESEAEGPVERGPLAAAEVVVVSSGDEDDDGHSCVNPEPDRVDSSFASFVKRSSVQDAADYGQVVDMSFLKEDTEGNGSSRGSSFDEGEDMSEDSLSDDRQSTKLAYRTKRRRSSSDRSDDELASRKRRTTR